MENNVKFGLGKLWRWKFWILGACILSGGISIYLSKQMHDEFKSTAAFVPPSFTSLGTMVFGNGVAYRGFYAADEEDIDRTVAYLESQEVIDTIAKKFDLYAHYGIDRNAENAAQRFNAVFKGNVKISFASNSVVEVECWDTNPQFAKDLADAYFNIASEYFEMISQRREGLKATRTQLEQVDAERAIVIDSLSSLRMKYNIYHIDDAGAAVSEILANKMRTEPKFNEFYDIAKSLELYLYSMELRWSDLRREEMARELNMKQYPSLLWVTQRPSISPFKDRPKRSIIVILAIMATAVFSSFLALVLDRSKPEEVA